jgi:hypothetical protein
MDKRNMIILNCFQHDLALAVHYFQQSSLGSDRCGSNHIRFSQESRRGIE